MQIQLHELRQVTQILFDHLDELGIKTIDLPHDYHWEISADDLYELSHEPQRHVVGQLSDDWADLHRLLTDTDYALAHDFVDLGAILRAIGNTVLG